MPQTEDRAGRGSLTSVACATTVDEPSRFCRWIAPAPSRNAETMTRSLLFAAAGVLLFRNRQTSALKELIATSGPKPVAKRTPGSSMCWHQPGNRLQGSSCRTKTSRDVGGSHPGSDPTVSPAPLLGRRRMGPAATAVKALGCAPTAGAAQRGLDCGPRRPNNPPCPGEGKKKAARKQHHREPAYTKFRTLPRRPNRNSRIKFRIAFTPARSHQSPPARLWATAPPPRSSAPAVPS